MIVKHFPTLGFLITVLALGGEAIAGPNVPTAPGTYRNWNREIDEVTIVQPFHAASYSEIAVESFDSSEVKMPDPKENTYGAVRSALRLIKPAFIDGLEKRAHRKIGENNSNKGALVIRARLITVDPGSQAARYWGGFGAGAVKIAMTGEIVDGSSQKILIRFKQERRSGFGAFGGGYGELFTRTARQIGGDIAGLLNAF